MTTTAKPKAKSSKPKQQKPSPNKAQPPATGDKATAPDLHRLSKFNKAERIQINRSALKNAAYNPRKITGKAKIGLRASIESHGMLQDPVWNRRTGNICGGHQRVEQLDMLEGTSEYSLYVIPIDVDEKTEKAINIALNNPNIQGEMDAVKIVEMFQRQEFDLELAGYTPIDIELLAFESGMPTDLIAGMFDSAGAEKVAEVTEAIDDVLEQDAALRQRQAESRRAAGGKQSQDEDEEGESEDQGHEEGQPANQHDAEYFRKARRKTSESMLAQRENGYSRIVVFGSDEQAEAFNEFMGIDPQETFIDGPMLAELCGCKLPPLKGKRKASAEDGIETADQGNV